ncbi:MAG: LAGLIDADG family homing endonuclease [Candidatus Berkelbacteria bacterium]|nr:LAGLIDADG family homing endonuclease [Candidatus Berkelbacteria bacterium]
MSEKIIHAYLQGAIHDGTYNKLHKTFRFTQSNQEWLKMIQKYLEKVGKKAWIYKEGKSRAVYALETTAKFLNLKFNPNKLSSKDEKIAYARGYFDSEGGIPKDTKQCFYIQLSQKNKNELVKLKNILESLGIKCGKIHIPSIRVDPNYYRFFISRNSHQEFVNMIGSWHARKNKIFKLRMKI